MSSSRRSRSRRFRGILVNLLVVVLGMVALFLLVGLFLPRQYRVEREIEIRTQPATVYADLVDLRRWPEWTVWNTDLDPTVRFEFDGPETGAGAEYRWTGDAVGQGRLKLTRAEPVQGVWYDLAFEGGDYESKGSLLFQAQGESLRVVWLNEGDLGRNPVNRYLGLFMDSTLGSQMQEGLARLKVRAESGAAASVPAAGRVPAP